MAPRQRAPCQICNGVESKYTCSKCQVFYCSVACYRQHKESSCISNTPLPNSPSQNPLAERVEVTGEEALPEKQALRPLSTLKWPYVPEESAYPDPLKRDDPKPLQLSHYEAIATSPALRKTLAAHPRLPELLRSIDSLRGPEREHALQRALGVTAPDFGEKLSVIAQPQEDVLALRELAGVIEAAVRGGKDGALGLDWE